MANVRVEVDTSDLQADLHRLVGGLTKRSPVVCSQQAETVAATVRTAIPVRTGRLRNTVTVDADKNGATVTYGGGLPYASYIDHRTHATANATTGTEAEFVRKMHVLAATEASRI